jgi:hypothetical protein
MDTRLKKLKKFASLTNLKKLITPQKQMTLKERIVTFLPYGKVIEKLYVAVFLAAFIVLLFKSSGTLNTEDKAMILVVAAGGLFILRSLRSKFVFPRRYTFILSLFLLFAILSTVFSVDIYDSFLRLAELFSVAVLSLLAYDIFQGKFNRRWILNAFTLILCVVVLVSIGMYVHDRTTLTFPLGLNSFMGGIILALLPFSLSSCLKTRKIKRFFFYIATAILLLGAALTFAIPIYIVGGIEIIAFVYINTFTGRKSLRTDRFYVPFLIVVVVVAFLTLGFHSQTSGQIPFDANNLEARSISVGLHLDLLHQGVSTFEHYFLVGSGLNSFSITSAYYQTGAWKLSHYMYNDILQMFPDAGIFGGLLFLALLGYVVYEMFNSQNLKDIFVKQSSETLEVSMGILAILVLSLYYPLLNVPVTLFILFVFIGMFLRDVKVDGNKKIYFGNLSVGIVNGLSIFFILLCGYFLYFAVVQYNAVKNDLSLNKISAAQAPLETLVKFVPFDTQYSLLLSQVYLNQNLVNKALTMNTLATRYNGTSIYVIYSKALVDYYKGDTKQSGQVIASLIAKAPYADPSLYLLSLQLNEKNTPVFKKELGDIVKRFPVNTAYNNYAQQFTALGYSDALAKVYIEYGLVTNNNAYFKTAQKLSPSEFGVFGQ